MVRGRISTASYIIALLKRSLTLHSLHMYSNITLVNITPSKCCLSTQLMQTCRQLLGYASQRVDKRQPFFLIILNKYAHVQFHSRPVADDSRGLQHSCRYYVISVYEQSTNQSQWSGTVYNGNTVHHCRYCCVLIIL